MGPHAKWSLHGLPSFFSALGRSLCASVEILIQIRLCSRVPGRTGGLVPETRGRTSRPLSFAGENRFDLSQGTRTAQEQALGLENQPAQKAGQAARLTGSREWQRQGKLRGNSRGRRANEALRRHP